MDKNNIVTAILNMLELLLPISIFVLVSGCFLLSISLVAMYTSYTQDHLKKLRIPAMIALIIAIFITGIGVFFSTVTAVAHSINIANESSQVETSSIQEDDEDHNSENLRFVEKN